MVVVMNENKRFKQELPRKCEAALLASVKMSLRFPNSCHHPDSKCSWRSQFGFVTHFLSSPSNLHTKPFPFPDEAQRWDGEGALGSQVGPMHFSPNCLLS